MSLSNTISHPYGPKTLIRTFKIILILNIGVVSMAGRLLGLTLTWLMTVFTIVAPVSGIQVSCSTGDVSSTESFNLDVSSSLHEQLYLNRGSIYQDRQASGTGKNSLTQSISGTGYSL